MGKCSRKDYISNLPHSIIDSILIKLPIRDAVRTSILSTNWRCQWTTMTQLNFDENCVIIRNDERDAEQDTVNFIMRVLLRHDGPIHKFTLSTAYLKTSIDIEQWLLFLSKKDIKELDIYVYRDDWWSKDQRFRTPSCMFSCQKLTKLKIFGYEVRPPLGFQGFPCLKHLNIYGGTVSVEAIENLITGCPLLEKFKFENMFDTQALTIRSPNLKHLSLYDAFNGVYLEHTPRLVSICAYLTTPLQGNFLVKVPVPYDCLKIIKLGDVNFEELNEVLHALHLIVQSPNLQELQIVTVGLRFDEATDLDFCERECPGDFTFKQLKIVDMLSVSSKNAMLFIKFVLGRSPVLEVLSISLNGKNDEKMKMVNQVLGFQRSFPKVEINLSD